MIFLTIGTLQPFDRLVQMVDTLAGNGTIHEPVVSQIGNGGYLPRNMQYHSVLKKDEFDRHMQTSSFVISHAGMGSIITAVKLHKPMIVVPRLKKYHEHVNDHQLDTALKFQELGVVLMAISKEELAEKMAIISDFTPSSRQNRTDSMVARISGFLCTLDSV